MSKDHVIVPDSAWLSAVEPAETELVNHNERRRFLRVKPDVLSAMLMVDGSRYVVAIRDISEGGALVVNAPLGLKVNDAVEMVVRLEDEIVDVRCRVARVEENPISPAIGVEFMDVVSENTEKLLSYVCKLGMNVIKR